MRCPACQVDLNESACRCPLCGGPAQSAPPAIPGLAWQDYPVPAQKRPRRSPLPPGRVVARAALALALPLAWAGYRRGVAVAALLCFAAALSLTAALALTVLLRRGRERRLAALLAAGALAAGALVFALARGNTLPAALAACALWLALADISALRGLCGAGLREEFRARFQI